jgi:hypothetical protein
MVSRSNTHRRLLFLVVLLFGLSACGSPEGSSNTPPVSGELPFRTDVYQVEIDGTTCFIVGNADGVGLSCDWGRG